MKGRVLKLMAAYRFLGKESGIIKNAQQSVQPTGGILRGLQAFFWLRVFSALGVLSRPAHQRLTQTVVPLLAQLQNHHSIQGSICS